VVAVEVRDRHVGDRARVDAGGGQVRHHPPRLGPAELAVAGIEQHARAARVDQEGGEGDRQLVGGQAGLAQRGLHLRQRRVAHEAVCQREDVAAVHDRGDVERAHAQAGHARRDGRGSGGAARAGAGAGDSRPAAASAPPAASRPRRDARKPAGRGASSARPSASSDAASIEGRASGSGRGTNGAAAAGHRVRLRGGARDRAASS
jgi:hypothetical protein